MADFSYVLFPCFVLSLFHFPVVSIASDTLNATQSIKDGDGETLVSPGGVFELGFFSPEHNSIDRYLGIWYQQIPKQTVVWVANRETPLSPSSGVLKLSAVGALTLLNGAKGNTVWSSNLSSIPPTGTQSPVVAQLLDSGNLVVRQKDDTTTGDEDHYRWQSFDYPGNTLLPGMKLGKNLVTGLDRRLTSWKTDGNPFPGHYTLGMRTQGFPQKVIWEGGSINLFRSRPWHGLVFSGLPHSTAALYETQFVLTNKEVSLSYRVLNASIKARTVLSSEGVEKGFTWDHHSLTWVNYYNNPTDECDNYASCGAYASCNAATQPRCKCLRGFVPKNPKNLSDGCVRRKELSCPGSSDEFFMYSGMKLPDTINSWFDRGMNLEGCKVKCLGNCSCSAYSSVDISFESGSGCVLWFGDLLDIKDFTDNKQHLYVRLDSADIGHAGSHWNKKVRIATWCIVGMVLLGSAVGVYFWRKRRIRIKGKLKDTIKNSEEAMEVPCFNYATMSNATNNFSNDNKLGEGGFGPVYKGKLEEQDIAVKVLSETSRQGSNEFKNEVLSIAKLQHRNLVKLLGCCIQKQKMLIYEYMPNKSLDYFIFDKERSKLLDWPKRVDIINGISRGLLYLHQDSRLRVVHRDLKASNILLDHEMNPKISDFGLARIFEENQTEANTNRVVGTHGYMSPEYATEGLFSTKSDVFSFGVLVLEIVSGKRNLGFNNPSHHFNLLGHAWKLYTEDKHLELIDSSMSPSCNSHEALLLIQLGLLCVQQYPKDRPDIGSVVQMIGGERQLFSPKFPGFFIERDKTESYSLSIEHNSSSNEGLITTLEPR